MKRKFWKQTAVGMLVFLGALNVQAGPISILLTVDAGADNLNEHNAETLAASYGAGSSMTLIDDHLVFNALSTADLLSSYDLIVFGWLSDSAMDVDWSTVILPYLMGGGAVIFEDVSNRDDLFAGSGLTDAGFGSPVAYSGVFGPNAFTSAHFVFTTSGSWDCFYTATTGCLSASNSFGSGRIIVSGPDEFWHENNDENDAYLRALADFVLVPEPGILGLLGIGLAGMGLSRRRKKI